MNLPELRTPCPLEACEAEPTTGMPLDVVHEATRAGTVRETRTAGAPSVSSRVIVKSGVWRSGRFPV